MFSRINYQLYESWNSVMEAILTYKIDISTTGFTYDLDAYQEDRRVSLYHQGWSFE